jgi:hypothetical protein
MIVTRQGRGELYDLEADPQERHNLRFVKPALFLELGEMLVQRFLDAPLLPATYREEAVSPSDREMLEALGYVN